MELKVSIQASVPTLDPGPTWADRSGTGGFDSPHLPVSGAVVFGTSNFNTRIQEFRIQEVEEEGW
jgi:hypothetical protein